MGTNETIKREEKNHQIPFIVRKTYRRSCDKIVLTCTHTHTICTCAPHTHPFWGVSKKFDNHTRFVKSFLPKSNVNSFFLARSLARARARDNDIVADDYSPIWYYLIAVIIHFMGHWIAHVQTRIAYKHTHTRCDSFRFTDFLLKKMLILIVEHLINCQLLIWLVSFMNIFFFFISFYLIFVLSCACDFIYPSKKANEKQILTDYDMSHSTMILCLCSIGLFFLLKSKILKLDRLCALCVQVVNRLVDWPISFGCSERISNFSIAYLSLLLLLWRLLLSTVGGVSIWTKQHCTNTQIHLHCLEMRVHTKIIDRKEPARTNWNAH